jgi:hypothetical protein
MLRETIFMVADPKIELRLRMGIGWAGSSNSFAMFEAEGGKTKKSRGLSEEFERVQS